MTAALLGVANFYRDLNEEKIDVIQASAQWFRFLQELPQCEYVFIILCGELYNYII